MKMIKVLCLALAFHLAMPLAYAQNAPTKLTKGDTFFVPTDGWFFTVEAEKKIRFKLLDAEYYEKAFKLSEDTNTHLKTKIDLEKQISERYRKAWIESDESLTKSLKREQRNKLLYLILGIGLTVGAGAAMGAVAR